jgi:hypothetical protein
MFDYHDLLHPLPNFCLDNRSHIDTTAVQTLIDTRTEVEKWADHPVEVRSALGFLTTAINAIISSTSHPSCLLGFDAL